MVYRADQRLSEFYIEIENGDFSDKMEELRDSLKSNAKVAYEQVDSEARDFIDSFYNGDKNSEVTTSRLYKANAIKIKHQRNVTARSITDFEKSIRVAIIQNSYLNNKYVVEQRSLGESFNNIIENYTRALAEDYGKKQVEVIRHKSKEVMSIKEAAENGLRDALAIDTSEGATRYAHALYFYDMYTMYNDTEMVQATLQLAMPSVDLMSGDMEFGSPQSERFDWSNIKPDDYVHDLMKLYLSNVPEINADGSQSYKRTLSFKEVSAVLRIIGERANERIKLLEGTGINIDMFQAVRSYMEGVIDNAHIVEHTDPLGNKTRKYHSRQDTVLHSLYNYLFRAKGKEHHNFVLNYSKALGLVDKGVKPNQYVGLLEKAAYMEMIPEIDQSIVSDMKDFALSVISLYTSYHIKDFNKSVYYNNGKLKVIHYNSESWRNISQSIKNMMSDMVSKGTLNKGLKEYFQSNVTIEHEADGSYFTISIKKNSWDEKGTPFLSYNNRTKSFSILTNWGTDSVTVDFQVFDHVLSDAMEVFKVIKDKIGLGQVTPAVFMAMMTAPSWNMVTDIFKASEENFAHLSNFMTNIRNHYLTGNRTPASFFADYIGTVITLNNMYAQDYYHETVEYDEEGTPYTRKYYETLTEMVQRLEEENNALEKEDKFDVFDRVPYNDVIQTFLDRTSYPGLMKFKEEEVANVYETCATTEEDDRRIRYPHGGDIWIAHDLMGSIIQKVMGKFDEGFKYTAEGKRAWNIALRSRLTNALPKVKSNNLRIVGLEECIGLERSIIGVKNLNVYDYVNVTVNTFIQEVLRSKSNPTLYVPLMTPSDKGTLITAKVMSDIVNNSYNRFYINYEIVARETLNIFNRIREEVSDARTRLDNTLSQIGRLLSRTVPLAPLDGIRRASYYSRVGLTSFLMSLSIEAHEKGVYDEFKRIISHSTLKKDPKGIRNFMPGKTIPRFDISFQVVDGVEVAVPGATIFNMVPGYKLFDKTFQENGVRNLSIMERIEHLLSDKFEGNGSDRANQLESMVHKLYKDDYIKMARDLKAFGYVQSGSQVELSRSVLKGQRLADDKSYYTGGKGANFNPQKPLFAFFLMTFLTNEAISQEGVDAFSFRDYYDQVKRNGATSTPGQSPLVNAMWNRGDKSFYLGGLTESNPILPYYDTEVNGGPTFQMIDGQEVFTDIGNEVESENGKITMSPLFFRFMARSFGGTTHTMLGDSNMLKMLNNYKRSDNSKSQIKSAAHVISSFDMQSPTYTRMFNRMMAESDRRIISALEERGLPVYSIQSKFAQFYDETKDFNAALDMLYKDIYNLQFNQDDSVNDNGVKSYHAIVSNIVAYMAPASTQKGSITTINEFNHYADDISVPMAHDTAPNADFKVIMNPSQETNTNKLQAFPSQIESFFGVNPNEEIRAMADRNNALKMRLQDILTRELNDKISLEKDLNGKAVPADRRFNSIDWVRFKYSEANEVDKAKADKALEQFISYYRKEVVNNLSISGEDLAYIDLFMSDDVSTNLPMMRQRLVQTYLNMVNKTIQGKTPGLRVTQNTGEYTMLYERNGEIYTYHDVLNELYGDFKVLSWAAYANSHLNNDVVAAGFNSTKLKYMEIDNEGNTTVGQVVMPNFLADKYGHRADESLLDIRTVNIAGRRVQYIDALSAIKASRTNDMEYWRAIADSPMIRKAIENLGLIDDINRAHNILSDPRNRISENRMLPLGKTANISGADIDKVAMLIRDNASTLNSVLEEANSLLDDFTETLKLVLSRVPAVDVGSAAVLRAVAFHNEGNVAYIPIGKTLIDDSDFDIDALTAYSNAIGIDGHIIRDGADGVRNELNSNRKAIMMHKDNQRSLFIKSSVKEIQAVGEANNNVYKEELTNSMFSSILDTYVRNRAGAEAIGILANTETAVSYVLSNYGKETLKVNPNGYLAKILEAATENNEVRLGLESFINKIGPWQQSALDNGKLGTFGEYSIMPEAVNILGMIAGPNDPQFIYNFFNNPYVRNILEAYAERSSIKTSAWKYDLYSMAKNAASNIERLIHNTPLPNFDILNEALGFATELKGLKGEELNTAIEEVSFEIYNRMVVSLLPILKEYYKPDGLSPKEYFNEGTNDVEELQRWIDETERGKYSLESLVDPINAKNILEEDSSFLEDIMAIIGKNNESADAINLITSLKALAEIRGLYDVSMGYEYVSMIPQLEVTANAMFRLSQILGLRNGIPVLDTEFHNRKNSVQLSLGMTLEDFVKVNSAEEFSLQRHMDYFEANSEYYNKSNTEEHQQLHADLREKEELIAKEINLPLFVLNMPHIYNAIETFQIQSNIKESMFIIDTALVKELQSKMLELQGMKAFAYGQQLADFNNAINDFVLDRYYQTSEENIHMIPSMSPPYRAAYGSSVWTILPGNIDLRDQYQRQEFVSGFPEYILDIIANKTDLAYLQATKPEGDITSDVQLKSMSDNMFLNHLEYKPKGDYIMLNLNSNQLNLFEISQLQDSFSELPDFLKNMFRNYELIRNRMNYKQGGILQIIGTDFFRGRLSQTYDEVMSLIRHSNGIQAFIGKAGSTSELHAQIDSQLQQKLFDFLGTNRTFPVFKSVPFFMNKGHNPTYVYNFGRNGGNRSPIFYKFNSIGEGYEEVYRISFSVTTNTSEDINSSVPVFKASTQEIDALNNYDGRVITHHGSTSLYYIKAGDFRMTQTGTLVKVTRVGTYSFNYKPATQDDINQLTKIIKEKNRRNNASIMLLPGEINFEILSPKKEFNYTKQNNSWLEDIRLQTLNSNGQAKEVSLVPNRKIATIKDLLHAIRVQAIMSIDRKAEYFKKESKKHLLDSHEYITSVAKNLLDDVLEGSSVMSANELAIYNAQVKAVAGYLNFTLPETLQYVIKQNVQAYVEEGGESALKAIGNMIFKETMYGPTDENLFVGYTRIGTNYGVIARDAVRQFVKAEESTLMKDAESINRTMDDHITLFNNNRYVALQKYKMMD